MARFHQPKKEKEKIKKAPPPKSQKRQLKSKHGTNSQRVFFFQIINKSV
jgi:hypothetical protein